MYQNDLQIIVNYKIVMPFNMESISLHNVKVSSIRHIL